MMITPHSPRWRIQALPAWPYPDTTERLSSAVFRSSWDDTLRLLRQEADQLGAGDPIALQLVCDPGDVRVDGMLRARAVVRHPGVIVTLAGEAGPVVLASDQYDQRYTGTLLAWQANVRAVALGLGALRAVDRYGITRRGEQYAGFRELEAGQGRPFRTAGEARSWLATITGLSAMTPAPELLARAGRALHPDAHQGDRSGWDHLDAARSLLHTGQPG